MIDAAAEFIVMMSIVSILLITIFLTIITIMRATLKAEHGKAQSFFDRRFAGCRAPSGAPIRGCVLIVELKADGHTISPNQFFFLEEGLIEDIVKAAALSKSDSGVLKEYSLRYLKYQTSTTLRIAFADTSVEAGIIKDLMLICGFICSMSLLAFFVLSVFLARWAVRPVENAWQRQKRFVADASHELKTPLTVILSNAEMLQSGENMDEKAQERVDNILAEGIRMKRLIENMLTLAKSDYAENTLVMSRVNLSDIILDSVLLYESAAYDDNKQLSFNVAEGVIVNGDADKLRQVIDILLDNALKYSNEGSQITVDLSVQYRREALVRVRSEGEAIPREELQNIFIRFYRVDKARENHGGFGLGLSIAEEIIQSHRGRIWAESDSSGNTFSFILPLSNH